MSPRDVRAPGATSGGGGGGIGDAKRHHPGATRHPSIEGNYVNVNVNVNSRVDSLLLLSF